MISSKEKSAVNILFGATGNLARVKLYPAMYSLYREGRLSPHFAVVGLGRRPWTQKQFHDYIEASLQDFARHDLEDDLEEFISHFRYLSLNVNHSSDYKALSDLVASLEVEFDIPGNRLFYLAIAPGLFETVSYNLKEMGLLDNSGWRRLIIEKPFGHDLPSAHSLNEKLGQVFAEEEIYRIDHYLGKEMVQNIEAIRFANGLFTPLWNKNYISNIQITSSEHVGIENRGPYYEEAGAIKDMVQNHMLQMVTLVAMEPPSQLKAEEVRNAKVNVLRSIRLYETADDVLENVVRGQYTEGMINNELVKSYRQEDNVDTQSQTETFVAARLWVDNERWDGVPIYIRTGKRLPKKVTEICVEFKDFPHLYNDSTNLEPNRLVIRIHPDEGVHLTLNVKETGTEGNIVPVSMNFNQNGQGDQSSPEAYERLLNDCLEGNSTYFTRWDEVEVAWQIVDPISDIWKSEEVPLFKYEAGKWGPEAAHDLLVKDGYTWWEVDDRKGSS